MGSDRRDGETAIWKQDARMLAEALDAGWSLPNARLRSGHTEDLTLILRVIASGWVEGWRVWLERRPDFASHPVLLETIISHAQDEILEVLLSHEDNKLDWSRDEDDLAPPHLLFQILRTDLRNLVEDAKVAKVANLLGRAGLDPQQPYPGDYSNGEIIPQGHTLWTWSLIRSYFDLAVSLDVGDAAFAMPRSQEAMDHWFDRAWVPTWISAGKVFDGGRARIAWLDWMTPDRFARWVQGGDHLKDLELHSAIRSLPAQYQAPAWSQWVASEPGEWSVLHDLVSSVLPKEEIQQVLGAMQAALPSEAWDAAWRGKDEYGLSAEGIWTSRQAESVLS